MTRNEKSGAAGPPVTGTSANMLFRKAGPGDCAQAQEIIRLARERMGRQGNPQWQDGYPADEDVRHDIEAGNGYVLCLHNRPVVYGAILFDEEPAYGPIEGRWLNDRPYAVVHRLAVHEAFERKGLAGLFLQQAERLCLQTFARHPSGYSLRQCRYARPAGALGLCLLRRDTAQGNTSPSLSQNPRLRDTKSGGNILSAARQLSGPDAIGCKRRHACEPRRRKASTPSFPAPADSRSSSRRSPRRPPPKLGRAARARDRSDTCRYRAHGR